MTTEEQKALAIIKAELQRRAEAEALKRWPRA